MRIVAGKYRHRIIDFPKSGLTRPTMDRVREALMSALMDGIQNRIVLDLFAGSGALGIESLSRGARKCYFVDISSEAIKIIKRNLKKLNVDEEYEVINNNYLDFLMNNKNLKFDLVFLDPPYSNKKVYDEVISFMLENDMLSENAIVVKEADVEFFEDQRFKKYKHYRYGMIHLNVYWR